MKKDRSKPFELFRGWTDDQKRAWIEKAAEDEPDCGIFACSPEIYEEMMANYDDVLDQKTKDFEQRAANKIDEEEDEK